MPEQSEDRSKPKDHGPKEIHIQIDRAHYTVKAGTLTGQELRHLPVPPIGADRDFFEVVPGGTDKKIGDADTVEIHNGDRFFTAPAQINPGLLSN